LDAPILLELLHGLQDHALLGVLGKLVDEVVRCGRGPSFGKGRGRGGEHVCRKAIRDHDDKPPHHTEPFSGASVKQHRARDIA
jgi:hypothetical protein